MPLLSVRMRDWGPNVGSCPRSMSRGERVVELDPGRHPGRTLRLCVGTGL